VNVTQRAVHDRRKPIPARDISRYIALWRAGRLPVERLLTSVSPMSEINLLLDKLADGEAERQIIVP